MAVAYAAFANGGIYHKPMYINKVVFSDGSEKEFSDPGTRAMKETTAYMMTEMMKTVLTSGTGFNAYISWLPQAGKTGTSNYSDEEIENHIKSSQLVAPDEMFVGYTRKYSDGRMDRLLKSSYSSHRQWVHSCFFSLSFNDDVTYREDDHPGDWTMPEGLYRSGEYVFKNGARPTWTAPATQQSSTPAPASQTPETSTSQSSVTTPNTNPNANTATPNAGTNENTVTQQPSTNQGQPNQNPQPAQQ